MSEGGVPVLYTFQGQYGEIVPHDVQKLIVDHGVEELPEELFKSRRRLREVILRRGLKRIGEGCFYDCEKLLEIEISITVRFIGPDAFSFCIHLKKIEFEGATASLSDQSLEIGLQAFSTCLAIARITLPPSVVSVGSFAFYSCRVLVEANLSRTRITEISPGAFSHSKSLRTASLPKTVEQIGHSVFNNCSELVTVVVPLNSHSIRIEDNSFRGCGSLANVSLPTGSTAGSNAFRGCDLLHQRYGEDASGIVTGLMRRFEGLLLHGMCYDQHSGITPQEFRECCMERKDDPSVDNFGMTPIHILCSVSEPRLELLEVFLDQYPYHTLHRKDATGKRALDYLIQNWTDGTASLVRVALKKCMLDPLVRWDTTNWVETMKTKVELLLTEHGGKERRVTLFNEVYSTFEKYQEIESTSILELALWKHKSEELGNGVLSKNEESLRLCGSGVVIPNVTAFFCGVNKNIGD